MSFYLQKKFLDYLISLIFTVLSFRVLLHLTNVHATICKFLFLQIRRIGEDLIEDLGVDTVNVDPVQNVALFEIKHKFCT